MIACSTMPLAAHPSSLPRTIAMDVDSSSDAMALDATEDDVVPMAERSTSSSSSSAVNLPALATSLPIRRSQSFAGDTTVKTIPSSQSSPTAVSLYRLPQTSTPPRSQSSAASTVSSVVHQPTARAAARSSLISPAKSPSPPPGPSPSSLLSSLSSSVTSLFRAPSSPAATSTAVFTLAEVAAHNTASSCWVVVHGRVYDMTHYLNLHPGGYRLLFQHAGGDATTDFDALRHSKRAVALLDAYYVGDLQGTRPMRLMPPGLGSAVKGDATGMLGDSLKLGAGVDSTRKPPVKGVSAAEVLKMQKRVHPIPRPLDAPDSGVAPLSTLRIQLTPSSSLSPRQFAVPLPHALPPLPAPSPALSPDARLLLQSLTFTVASVDSPYPDAKRIVLLLQPSSPSSSTPLLLPNASHVTLSLPLTASQDGPSVRRQYTPIACTASSLTLLVKTYTARQAGSWYLSSLLVGASLSLTGPFSSLSRSLSSYSRLVLICMGSGITPMYQLLTQQFSAAGEQPTPLLLYSARSEDTLWLRHEIDDMLRQRPSWSAVYQLTQSADASWPHQGRIDQAVLRTVFDRWALAKGAPGTEFFAVCGSDDFNAMVLTALKDGLAVPASDIHVF